MDAVAAHGVPDVVVAVRSAFPLVLVEEVDLAAETLDAGCDDAPDPLSLAVTDVDVPDTGPMHAILAARNAGVPAALTGLEGVGPAVFAESADGVVHQVMVALPYDGGILGEGIGGAGGVAVVHGQGLEDDLPGFGGLSRIQAEEGERQDGEEGSEVSHMDFKL